MLDPRFRILRPDELSASAKSLWFLKTQTMWLWHGRHILQHCQTSKENRPDFRTLSIQECSNRVETALQSHCIFANIAVGLGLVLPFC